MKRFFSLFIVALVCVSCNNRESGNKGNSQQTGYDTTTDTYWVPPEDTAMNFAIAKAKQTIDQFDEAFISKNSAYTDFAIKKRFAISKGGGEHLWISGITIVNGAYKGFISNDVENANQVKYGDTVIVQKAEITDWMYLDNNVLKGGYTLREMRNKLTEKERIKFDSESGFIIKD